MKINLDNIEEVAIEVECELRKIAPICTRCEYCERVLSVADILSALAGHRDIVQNNAFASRRTVTRMYGTLPLGTDFLGTDFLEVVTNSDGTTYVDFERLQYSYFSDDNRPVRFTFSG